jgi:DNA repair exonuclease SbcCD ATPase subunit
VKINTLNHYIRTFPLSQGNSSSSSSELAKLGVEVAATAKHLKLVDDLAKQVSAEVKKDGDEAALLLSNVRQIGLPPKNQSEAINQTLAELRAQAKEVGQQLAEAKAKRLELEQKADKELARSRQELARAKKEWEEVQREFELVSQLDTRANKAVETVADAVKEAEKVELLLNSGHFWELTLPAYKSNNCRPEPGGDGLVARSLRNTNCRLRTVGQGSGQH